MDPIVDYKGNLAAADGATNRRVSPNIWADCPILHIILDPGVGYGFKDDFVEFPDPGTITTLVNVQGYEIFGEAATTATAGTATGGELVVTCGTTADGDFVMQLGGGSPFIISDTAGDDRKLWFEVRYKVSAITNDIASLFIGLHALDRAVNAGVFTATQGATVDSALADFASLGFWRPDADGDNPSVVYNKAGQVATEAIADSSTLVADTYLKTGFVYDPSRNTAERIEFYENNIAEGTWVTGTNIATATFPDAVGMTPTISFVNDDGATDQTLTIDWWRCYQLSPGAGT